MPSECTQAERGRREALEKGASCDLKAAQVTLQIQSWLWLLACDSQPWTGLTASLPAAAFLLSHPAGQLPCVCAGAIVAEKSLSDVVSGRNVFFFATEKALNFIFKFSHVFLELSLCCVVQGNKPVQY